MEDIKFENIEISKERKHLELQKKLFKLLQIVIDVPDQTSQKTYRQEWISHISSGYERFTQLEEKRKAYELLLMKEDTMRYVKKLLKSKLAYGGSHFINATSVIILIENLLEKAINDEKYEIAHILHQYLEILTQE